MATIIEMRQELTDLGRELEQATKKGYEMAHDPKTEIEALQNQSDAIDRLQVRMALIKQDIAREEGTGSQNAEPVKSAKPRNGGFASLGEFVNAVHEADTPGGSRDKRLARVTDATGANETTGADGGYLVPPEYADGILDLVKDESVIYPQARRVQINGNRLIEVYLNETNRKDPSTGSRHGGVLAYWKGEADQYQAVKAAFAERTTNLSKLTAYCPVTEELLQDYAAIEGTLNDLVGREFAFKIDDAMFNGSGANNIPLGILTTGSGSNPNNAALVTIAKESGQAAGTVNVQNILKMYNALIAQQRKKAKWYINQDLEIVLMQIMLQTGSIASTGASAVEGITGTFGMPIYTPPGAYGNANATMLGLPVEPNEHCAAAGSVGDIVLADMSQYLIIERAGVTKQSSIHVRFDYDETVFKFTWRAGGRPDWMSSIEAYKGSTKRSPYVALATRS